MENRLKELRKEKNLTQADFGKIMSVTSQTVSKWERGEIAFSNEVVGKLTDYFNVTSDYLLGFTDQRAPKRLVIPDEIKNARFAFHRGDFEDLTQEEVDSLAVMARMLKEQRKQREGKEGD